MVCSMKGQTTPTSPGFGPELRLAQPSAPQPSTTPFPLHPPARLPGDGGGGAGAAGGEDAAVPPQLPQHLLSDDSRRGVAGPSAAVVSLSSAAYMTSCEASAKLFQLTTFENSELHILRGMDLASMLYACGRIFQSAAGSETTYTLSKQVERLAAFISHNWVVPRWLKFIALAFYYNFGISCACCLAVTCLIGVLQGCGVLPVAIRERHVKVPYESGMGCRLLSFPVFMLAVVFSRSMFAWLGYRGPAVFLDKCCIHQVDAEKMRLGILKLGAFIHRSDNIVVLYTNVYLAKIWTVYEVACFLLLHPDKQMTIVPVHLAVAFFVISSILYFMNLMTMTLNVVIGVPFMFYAGNALTLLFGLWVWRQWCKQRQQTRNSLGTFSVRKCTCAVESDRALVYGNICLLMRSCGQVRAEASDEDVLDAFDTLVKRKIPPAFAKVLDDRGFHWYHYLFFGWIANGNNAVDRFSRVAYGMPLRDGAAEFGEGLFWACVGFPLVILVSLKLTGKRLNLTGWKEIPFSIGVVLFILALTFVMYLGWHEWAEAAKHSDAAMISLFASIPVCLPVLWLWTGDACLRRRVGQPVPLDGNLEGSDLATLDEPSLDLATPAEPCPDIETPAEPCSDIETPAELCSILATPAEPNLQSAEDSATNAEVFSTLVVFGRSAVYCRCV